MKYNTGDEVWVKSMTRPLKGRIVKIVGDYCFVRVYQDSYGTIFRRKLDDLYKSKDDILC